MEYVCTICAKRKRRTAGPLPAIDRYLNRRIRWVYTQSRRLARPMFILSGRFGLLAPDDRIPWYDHALTEADVTRLLPRVVQQLAAADATSLVFFARPRSTPGWKPYYELLERACRTRAIPLRVRRLGSEFV